ncbi:MAG: enoyl-CoA hydratase/isomerase family protein, partial [Bacteroidales bacterium]|nr:enoyl-CoA hydratase/isomerase family protein [Bacteroidales bacterium]
MNYTILKPVSENGILTLTLSRPQALNALNSLFFHEMDHLIEAVKDDESIRVMIITGEGKAFVAGADIAEMVHKTDK